MIKLIRFFEYLRMIFHRPRVEIRRDIRKCNCRPNSGTTFGNPRCFPRIRPNQRMIFDFHAIEIRDRNRIWRLGLDRRRRYNCLRIRRCERRKFQKFSRNFDHRISTKILRRIGIEIRPAHSGTAARIRRCDFGIRQRRRMTIDPWPIGSPTGIGIWRHHSNLCNGGRNDFHDRRDYRRSKFAYLRRVSNPTGNDIEQIRQFLRKCDCNLRF